MTCNCALCRKPHYRWRWGTGVWVMTINSAKKFYNVPYLPVVIR